MEVSLFRKLFYTIKYSIIQNINNQNNLLQFSNNSRINPLASPSAGDLALKYGDVNTETTSPGEVKGLIVLKLFKFNK